jgi:hypothetical protein
MHLLVSELGRFMPDVYARKIYINVPKTHYLKKNGVMQTVHLTAYKATVYQPYYLTVNQKSDVLNILKTSTIFCYLYMGVLLCFSYILGN